jgi:hypothetical protein
MAIFGKEKEKGVVSIFLNIYFQPDNDLIGWYDEDESESGDLRTYNLEKSDLGSWGDSFREKVFEAVKKYNISQEKSMYLFKLYGTKVLIPDGATFTHEHEILKGVKSFKLGAMFLGNFAYSK